MTFAPAERDPRGQATGIALAGLAACGAMPAMLFTLRARAG